MHATKDEFRDNKVNSETNGLVKKLTQTYGAGICIVLDLCPLYSGHMSEVKGYEANIHVGYTPNVYTDYKI
jgi:hypothetical protein